MPVLGIGRELRILTKFAGHASVEDGPCGVEGLHGQRGSGSFQHSASFFSGYFPNTGDTWSAAAAAAAAKSLQSCPTLCDPIDGSPPGSAVPGILQARTLEWVAISFSNA